MSGVRWAHARAAVRPIGERLSLEEKLRPYQDRTWVGEVENRPTLYLDDVSEIPFLDEISGVEEYQHRARVRAGEGDLFATVTRPVAGYEEYCRERLQLGRPEGIVADVVTSPIAVTRACSEGTAFQRLVECARPAGLVIHPYMSIEPVWALAGRIRDETGNPVTVIGPPPPVTELANDKALFSEVVGAVLGEDWLVDTRMTTNPAELASHLLELAENHRLVALKRARCASGMGNLVLEAPSLAGMSASSVEKDVRSFLERTQWDGEETVLAVGWEQTDVTPSTQLWLPPVGVGTPKLEGIYEQILAPGTSVFMGSRPSTLSAALNRRIGNASLEIAAAFQDLGYVGRCSFDLLVVGDPEGDYRVRFVECNGRWGGTSIPMHLVDRLVGTPRPPYRAQDFVHSDLIGGAFEDVLDRVGDSLYDAENRRGRFIFYNVGPMAGSGKIDVIAISETQQQAEGALEDELPTLLGL